MAATVVGGCQPASDDRSRGADAQPGDPDSVTDDSVTDGGASDGSTGAAPPLGTGIGSGLGINLQNVSYYAPDWLFVDAIKSSRIGAASGYGSSVATDADGWPTADCSFILWTAGIFTGTSGTYALSFHGQATIGGTFAIANQHYDAATNTTTAEATLAADGFAGLIFTDTRRTPASATNSGVTDVACIKPGYVAVDLFTRPILKLIAKFGVLRFMDFTATNWSQQVAWSDRVPPTHATQAVDGAAEGYGWEGKGAAWEYAIALANRTHKDAWINVPARASDDYVQKLALLFRDGGNGFPGLDPTLRLYVEYSNEVWNGGFSQAHENHDAAVAEVAAGGSPLAYDGLVDSGGWQYAWRRVGKRAVEISKIFRAVFGDAAMMTRIRPVLEWQQGNAQATAMAELTFLDNYYNNGDGTHVADPHPVSYYLYGGGGSAYYAPDTGAVTVDTIWSSGTMSPAAFATICQVDADWTAAFGIKRIAYEGGPSFDKGTNDAAKAAAWGDARMNQSMRDHDAVFRQNGGDLLVYFQSTGDYQWGFTHDVQVLSTPKLTAIDAIGALAPAPASYGAAVPGTIDAAKPQLRNTWNESPANMKAGDWFAYSIHVAQAGSYVVTAHFTGDAGAGVVLTIDGAPVASPAASVTLAPGLHAIGVRARSGSVSLSELTVL